MFARALFQPDPNLPPPGTGHGGNVRAAIYTFAAVSLALTTLTLVMRIYTKLRVMRARGWDDYLMILGWLGFLFQWIVLLCAVHWGAGSHEQDVQDSDIVPYAKLLFIHELMYPWLMCEIKTSIALQLLRIFVPNAHLRCHRGAKFWIIWIFVAVEIAWFLSYFFASLFQCSPVARTYNWSIPGTCLAGFPAFNVAVSAFNMATDLLMLTAPMFWIYQLKLPLSKKIAASGVFVVALLAFASSLLRLIYAINRLAYVDITFTLTQVALSTAAEEAAGILVGNVVPLPRLVSEITTKAKRKSVCLEQSLASREKRDSAATRRFDPLYTSTTSIADGDTVSPASSSVSPLPSREQSQTL